MLIYKYITKVQGKHILHIYKMFFLPVSWELAQNKMMEYVWTEEETFSKYHWGGKLRDENYEIS